MFSRAPGEGSSSWSNFAVWALRTRASKLEIWSLIAILGLLPARFYHAGELTPERQLPETDPAELELAVIGSRPPASRASVVLPDAKLRGPLRLRDDRFFCHSFCSRERQARNGIPRRRRRSSPSSSLRAVVTVVMFIPLILYFLL